MSWSSDQISLLIDEYRKHPVLYFVKHKDYHNKMLRGHALQKVMETLRVIRLNVRGRTAEEICRVANYVQQ